IGDAWDRKADCAAQRLLIPDRAIEDGTGLHEQTPRIAGQRTPTGGGAGCRGRTSRNGQLAARNGSTPGIHGGLPFNALRSPRSSTCQLPKRADETFRFRPRRIVTLVVDKERRRTIHAAAHTIPEIITHPTRIHLGAQLEGKPLRIEAERAGVTDEILECERPLI